MYKFTQSSIDKVRKTLTYAKTEAQIALNEAQTQYDVGVLTAGLSYDETMLASSLAEQSYNNTIAQLSNDLAAKTLEIGQLLADIYDIQCSLVEDDYRDQRDDLKEAYEDAIEDVEDASEISEELKECAEIIAQTDLKMQSIRQKIENRADPSRLLQFDKD